MNSFLDISLDATLYGDKEYPFLREEVRRELRERGIIVIGSKTDFFNSINCKEYLRLYLNQKHGFKLKKGQLSHFIEIGILTSDLSLSSRIEPENDYICIYTSFYKDVATLNACIEHVGIVIDKTNAEDPIILSKYNHSNLIIHSAQNKEIMNSFCSEEGIAVLFINIEALKFFIQSLF